jgi:mRNA interferase MazF
VVIRQGDVFWLDLGEPSGSAPGYRHPHLVVQNDVFNASRIATTVVCALTSNLKRAEAPGNVLLKEGEAALARSSVVNVSQIITVDKADLVEKIGSLSRERLLEVLDGFYLLLEPRELAAAGE